MLKQGQEGFEGIPAELFWSLPSCNGRVVLRMTPMNRPINKFLILLLCFTLIWKVPSFWHSQTSLAVAGKGVSTSQGQISLRGDFGEMRVL